MDSSRPQSIIVFGDVTIQLLQTLLTLSTSSKHDHVLGVVLDRAWIACRNTMYDAGTDVRGRLVKADSLVELAKLAMEDRQIAAVCAMPLACAAQMGLYIRQLLRGHVGGAAMDVLQPVIMVGDGPGMLAAAAAACARSLTELMSMVPKVVGFAARLGIAAAHTAATHDACARSWSTLVAMSGDAAQEELKAFGNVEGLPKLERPYISKYADSVVTISGPPSSLELLFNKSPSIRRCRPKEIAGAYWPMHAEHLPAPDFRALVDSGSAGATWAETRHLHHLLISPVDGAPYEAEDLRCLLVAVASDLFGRSARWDRISTELVTRLGARQGAAVSFVSIGDSSMGTSLYHRLRGSGPTNCTFSACQWGSADDAPTGEPETGPEEGYNEDDIAVVGYSCRLPGADSNEAFWHVLEGGVNMQTRIPPHRLAVGEVPQGSEPLGCFYDGLEHFDCKLFNMSPREALQTDPGQRLLLLTTFEALEMAGYNPDSTPSTDRKRIGTFVGQTIDDWREYNVHGNIDMFYATGTIRAFGPGRLNYYFKWDGPSYSFDTACSSSSVALQMACASLLRGECDTAVAGGANALTGPAMFHGLKLGGFLSPTGPCKTFDAQADGYCRADGVGVVVLKRLRTAVEEGDNIRGVIKASATNHSARAISITHPHAPTQASLFRKVLAAARLEPEDIDYVEMHGTGTPAGDGAEIHSVSSVFGPGRPSGALLYAGAAKANVGHGEAAAGITSVIKALLMFHCKKIPPHIGITTQPTPLLSDPDSRVLTVPVSVVPWAGDGHQRPRTRRVMVNNFSAAGGNTCLILEEAPRVPKTPGSDPRTYHTVVLSARSDASLRNQTRRLLEFCTAALHQEQTGQEWIPGLADIAYTTTARRMHLNVRKAFTAATVDELARQLSSELVTWGSPASQTKPAAVALLFTGNGGCYGGMGKQLFETCPGFRNLLGCCDDMAAASGFGSFLHIIEGSADCVDAHACSLVHVQLATVAVEYALAWLLQSWGLKFSLVCGHSLGEYAAMAFVGVISLAQMIHLVGSRAQLAARHCAPGTHVMLAIRAPTETVDRAIHELRLQSTEVSCLNSPSDVVYAGPAGELDALRQFLVHRGVKSSRLTTPCAFHSSQMDPILAPLSEQAAKVPLRCPKIPYASTVLGRVLTVANDFPPDYVVRHCRQRVNMTGALLDAQSKNLAGDSNTIWVECGPGALCLPMVAATRQLHAEPRRQFACLRRNTDCWKNLASILALSYTAGTNVSWPEYHRDYRAMLSLVDLPSYAFDLKPYRLLPKDSSPVSAGTAPSHTQDDAGKPLAGQLNLQEVATAGPQLPRDGLLHRVVRELRDFTEHSLQIQFASDLHVEGPLRTMAQGHMVDGHALVPSSIYLELSLAAASYLEQLSRPAHKPFEISDLCFDVLNMAITRPLIVQNGDADQRVPQVILVTATYHSQTKLVDVEIRCRLGSAGTPQLHASCAVVANKRKERINKQPNEDILQPRLPMAVSVDQMDAVNQTPRKRPNHQRLSSRLIYRAFTTVVSYDQRYHGIQDMTIQDEEAAATATVRFKSRDQTPESRYDGIVCDPYRSDNIMQLGGFVMNIAFARSLDHVYISSGWEKLHLYQLPFADDVDYLAHVHMSPSAEVPGVYSGHVRLVRETLGGDTVVVAVCDGLKFKEMTRRTLHGLLQPLSREEPTSHAPVPAVLGAVRELRNIPSQPNTLAGPQDEQGGARADQPQEHKPHPWLQDGGIVHSNDGAPETKAQAAAQLDLNGLAEPVTARKPNSSEMEIFGQILCIIAEETGYEAVSWADDVRFDELGVDSLLTTAILGRIYSLTGKDLSSSTFLSFPTVGDLRAHLGAQDGVEFPTTSSHQGHLSSSSELPTLGSETLSGSASSPATAPKSSLLGAASSHDNGSATPLEDLSLSMASGGTPEGPQLSFRSHSTLLSGVAAGGSGITTTGPPVFLVPDGTGSALAYAHIGQQLRASGQRFPLYGFDSPFLASSVSFGANGVTTEQLAAIYLREVRRIQPRGPYRLGGWSIGGIHAFEMARQLVAAGEEVDLLCIIDSPCPGTLPSFPPELIFEGIGVDPSTAPPSMVNHIRASLASLAGYRPPPPQRAGSSGRVANACLVIWAGNAKPKTAGDRGGFPARQAIRGRTGGAEHDDVHGAARRWFFGTRNDYGPCGWDALTGAAEVEVRVISDSTHFDIVKGYGAVEIANALADVDEGKFSPEPMEPMYK